jgi:hypothetical protein
MTPATITRFALALSFSLCGCGSDEQPASPPPVPSPPPEPPAATDPTVLPAVAPVEAPSSSADGFSIAVDTSTPEPTVTTRNDGTQTFEGNIRYHLVWVGPEAGAAAAPWRAVGAVPGCPLPDPAPRPTPIFSWSSSFGPGGSNSWNVAADPVSYCRGGQIEGGPAPAGSYRISASFERQDGTVERVIWSPPFTRTAGAG